MKFGDNYVPLGELGEIISGSTPDTAIKSYWGGNIPWITPADLTEHTGIYFRGNLRKITQAGYNSCSTKLLPPGSIVFSSRAPIGHCAVTTFPLCTNQGFKNIVPNKRLDPVYGFFALKFFTPEIVALGRGATFAEINKEIFENFRIPLPPLPQQKRIAVILEKADRVRRQRRYALALSDTYLQTVFLVMFGDPVTNPREWDSFIVDSICELVRGSSPRPQGDSRYFGGPVPRLMIADMTRDGIYVIPKIDSLTEEGAKQSRWMEAGSVVMSVSGLIGQPAVLKVDACIHDGFVGFRNLHEKLLPDFLAFLLQTMRQMSRSQAVGAIWQNLTTDQIKNWSIVHPPLILQQQFAQIVQKFERLRAQQREAERQAEHLFQTLLHRAFQGELTQEAASQDTSGEEAHSMDEPAVPYPLTAPARLIVKETEQLALPME